jgi:hypothetical protein
VSETLEPTNAGEGVVSLYTVKFYTIHIITSRG